MKTIKHMIALAGLSGGLLAAVGAMAAQETVAPAITNDTADFSPRQGMRMNFRGVPLEQVLSYLSKAAGYVIHPRVPVSGKVDAWSDEPLSKEEALDLLKHMLNDNGFTAIQDGRILTIISSYDAKKSEIPVRKFTTVSDIPRTAEIATYIIPVRSLNPIALVRNLTPLVDSGTDLQANESANSILVTDTQVNIRRLAEIMVALDSVSSSANSIKVYPLKYADAATMAGLVKELFPSQDSRSAGGGNSSMSRFAGPGGGGFPGGGFPGFPGAMMQGGNNASSAGQTPASRITAVADDHSNALVVSAPDSLVPTIDQLVEKIDQPVDDVTVVKVIGLKNADPTEMADVLANLFPDEASSTDANRAPIQFGAFGSPGMGAQDTSGGGSERMKRMGRVSAVADRRTAAIVVSAARELMPQIEAMVSELDASPANKQRVHVIALKNADTANVMQVLQDLFPSGTASTSASTSLQNDPLTLRSQTLLNNMLTAGTTSGLNLGGSSSSSGQRGQ